MSSLFGNTQNQPTTSSSAPGPSLSGNTSTNQTTSLFGSNPGAGTASLFSNPQPNNASTQPQQRSLFAPSAQTAPSGPAASTFGGLNPMSGAGQFQGGMSLQQQQELARTRLQQAGMSGVRGDEKSVFDQVGTLVRRWDPGSQDTLLQTYLYNAVSAAYAPFYSRPPTDSEAAFEAALAAAPKLEFSPGNENLRMVPVLVRGFHDLGDRVEYQAKVLLAMQERLHEMNNSLSAVMAAHEQRITVLLESGRRMHSLLAQRTLRLSVKLQVLRNRGYALDAQEEALRKQLLSLSQSVTDPSFAAREEEVWARMLALRERARWLEEEGKRLGEHVASQRTEGNGEGAKVPDYVLDKTRKILKDYDGQLKHLRLELEDVKKEFGEWEDAQAQGRGGR